MAKEVNPPAPFMVAIYERPCECPNQFGDRCFGLPEMKKVYVVELDWKPVSREFDSYDEAHAEAMNKFDLMIANRKQCAKRFGQMCRFQMSQDGDIVDAQFGTIYQAI